MIYIIKNIKENLYFRSCNPEYKQSRKGTFNILKNMGVQNNSWWCEKNVSYFFRVKIMSFR